MSESKEIVCQNNDSTRFDKIEFEEKNDLSKKDVKELNDAWKKFSQTLDNNKITQQTKDYLLEKGKDSLKSKKNKH